MGGRAGGQGKSLRFSSCLFKPALLSLDPRLWSGHWPVHLSNRGKSVGQAGWLCRC